VPFDFREETFKQSAFQLLRGDLWVEFPLAYERGSSGIIPLALERVPSGTQLLISLCNQFSKTCKRNLLNIILISGVNMCVYFLMVVLRFLGSC
jgi:hypothetical protein